MGRTRELPPPTLCSPMSMMACAGPPGLQAGGAGLQGDPEDALRRAGAMAGSPGAVSQPPSIGTECRASRAVSAPRQEVGRDPIYHHTHQNALLLTLPSVLLSAR